MKKLNAAIIGTGGIAGLNQSKKDIKNLTHIKSIKANKKLNLIAVADKNKTNLIKFVKKWSINNYYIDYKKLLSENDIDIIFISTPVNTHYRILKDIQKTNIKKIFCEKPFLSNMKEHYLLRDYLNNIFVSVNYFRRWNKDLIKLKKEICKKKYGKLKKVNFFYTKSLLNNGLHILDICLFFFGIPKKVVTKKSYKISKSYEKGYDFNLIYKSFSVNFTFIPSVKYSFFEANIFFEDYYLLLTDRIRKIFIYKSFQDKDFNYIREIKLFNQIETKWPFCFDNAIDELVNAKNNKNISHNHNDNFILTQIYEKIIKS